MTTMTQTRHALLRALPLLWFLWLCAAPARGQVSSTDDAATVKRIMTNVLARCHTVRNGVRTITFEPPTNQEVAELMALGDRAIPALAAYVDSEQKDGLTELSAVKFLMAIGGPGTFTALQRAFAEDEWEVTRAAALAGMFAISESRARPFVEAALKDKSEVVRNRAQHLWALYRETNKGK